MLNFPKHRLTAGAVIKNDKNEILMIKNPTRGWELPGGHVEEGETIPDALVREVYEETGITVEIESFCGISQEVKSNICNTWWLGRAIGGSFQTSNESLEVNFYNLNDALKLIEREDFKKELLYVANKEQHPFYLNF
jgi:8-oxo-dGTP diphosphatase